MSTTEKWIDEEILSTTWINPLTKSEVAACFQELSSQISSSENMVHVLFNIENSGSIPSQAPFDFIKAQLATLPKMGNIAVVGLSPIAQILAQMATRMTGQTIVFFKDESEALAYLRS